MPSAGSSSEPGTGADRDMRRGSREDRRRRFDSWERLRLPYNAVMLPIGAFVAWTVYRSVVLIPAADRHDMLFGLAPLTFVVVGSLLFAAAANVLYLLGYAFEITFIEFTEYEWTDKKRYPLFLAGLAFSIAVEIAVWLRFTGLAAKYVH